MSKYACIRWQKKATVSPRHYWFPSPLALLDTGTQHTTLRYNDLMYTWGPLDIDVLEYARVRRKNRLNQVTQNRWSTPLANQVSDRKKENKNRSEKMAAISSMGENEWKTIRTHNNQT